MACPALKFSFGWSTIIEAIGWEVWEVEDSIELGFVSRSMACENGYLIETFECNEMFDGRESEEGGTL